VAFEESAIRMINAGQPPWPPVSLLLMDLDHFKSIKRSPRHNGWWMAWLGEISAQHLKSIPWPGLPI